MHQKEKTKTCGFVMIVYDNILDIIRKSGGIQVLFGEIKSRLKNKNIKYIEPKIVNRHFERYRDFHCYQKLIEPYSIFHSTYYRLPDVETRYKYKLKTVTTVHDFTYENEIGGLKGVVHSWQKNRAIRNSDKIICVSENTRKDLFKYLPDIDREKVSVVHNGYSNIYYQRTDITRLENTLIFVGARGGYKNFELLIKALSKSDTINLVIIGGGPLSKKEQTQLNQYIPERFFHTGLISQDELAIWYNRATALVYPSLYEGFGIPILEAFASGCPVIAFNSSSIPEVAGDAAYLFDCNTVDDLATKIEVCLSDKVKRAEMVEKGLARADLFSWDKCFEETLSVYKKLM